MLSNGIQDMGRGGVMDDGWEMRQRQGKMLGEGHHVSGILYLASISIFKSRSFS